METIVQDLRYGVRQLRSNPGFTAIAVLTLALGIAVNATMFSLVSAFLLRRPPGRDPERVAVVSSVNPAPAFHADASLSPPPTISPGATPTTFLRTWPPRTSIEPSV